MSLAGAYGVRYDLWRFTISVGGLARVARTIDSQINYANRPLDDPNFPLYLTHSHKASNSTRISANIPLSINYRFLDRFEVGYTMEFGAGLDISDTAGTQWFATKLNQGVQLRILVGGE